MLSDHASEVVMIGGHSNIIPVIIEELGSDPIPLIAKNDYDDLFSVTAHRSGRAKVILLNYGEPTDFE
ncbi:MAG: hypothetical protein MUO67_17890 [Anaerolineales bacterium]|nr:hypothetical protein [Anaerolineales bacterium]